jgi:hypothetical protein
MTTPITIPTDLLEAVARWALPAGDDLLRLSQVRIADGELVATDGKRGVRVPIQTHDQTLGIWRADALMAVAAQDAMHEKRVGARRPSGRSIAVEPIEGGRLRLHLAAGGMPSLVVRACTESFPLEPLREIFGAVSLAKTPTPDGISFDPALLAAIDEVKRALTAREIGVRVVQWGGPLDPMIFEGPALEGCGPSRFVVMPMMPMMQAPS